MRCVDLRHGLLAAALCLTGCAARMAPTRTWDRPCEVFLDTWQMRAEQTATAALLARVDFEASSGTRSFTLEVFFRAPDVYLLRGRGTLGVTGFRARLSEDSLVVLLDRDQRGFAGAPEAFPDTKSKAMWALLRDVLPWLVGQPHLTTRHDWRLQAAERGTRPALMEVQRDGRRLELTYGRYRGVYPFWHLRRVRGLSPEGSLALDFRQQLYNISLDSAFFDLRLPPDTRPLLD